MLNINVSEAASHLNSIIRGGIKTSVMLWGPPGIGKSSVVNQVARQNGMEVIDLRLSQLAPTDLRGLPYVKDEISRFARPNFFPQSGTGILFLDEINLAPPAIQNVAMQLVLDGRVGEHVVPGGWFTFAAGNRIEDRAAVSQMPAPLANRFLHFTIECSLDSWKSYALKSGVREEIISFLNFRPNLLHSFDKNAIAWASPRTWEFASKLLDSGLPVDPAVGQGAASEFNTFIKLYTKLPDIEKVLEGDMGVKMPSEPSMIYAISGALVSRSQTSDHAINATKWMVKSTTEDFVSVMLYDLMQSLENKDLRGEFAQKVAKTKEITEFTRKFMKMIH
jgi:hypothetical protein